MPPDHTTIGIDRWTAGKDRHHAGVAQSVERRRLPVAMRLQPQTANPKVVSSSLTPGTNPTSGGGSARSWMRVRLVQPRHTRVGDKAKRGGVPLPIPAQRRCNMCSPGQTSRVSIGETQGGCETTPIGVAQNGNSGGGSEQTATRSLKVCPAKGRRFDLVVITRNESRFRGSMAERLIRTQQTVVQFHSEAPGGRSLTVRWSLSGRSTCAFVT